MNRKFQQISGVTHLKPEPFVSTLPAHEHRSLRCFSSHGFGSPPDSRSSRPALRSRDARPTFWVSPAVDLHGLRAVDLARKSARHRSLSQRQARNALSSRFPPAVGTLDFGRCQRATRLAAVAGAGPRTHLQSPTALRGRGSGVGTRPHRLCLGLDDHRPFPDPVFVGGLSFDQGRDQAAHPTRLARPHPPW